MNDALTREQVRRVDRIAIEEYGMCGLVLMENAGRNATVIMTAHWRSHPPDRVLAFAGTGNNGGDGFVIARHLANTGMNVRVGLVGDVDRMTRDAASNHRICVAMGIPIEPAASLAVDPGDWLVDALLGTGFQGEVRQATARVIEQINASTKRGVVAIDVPSGLDCDTGRPSNATVRADLTVTFVANKVGFASDQAKRYVGRVCVADIGAPTAAVRRATNP